MRFEKPQKTNVFEAENSSCHQNISIPTIGKTGHKIIIIIGFIHVIVAFVCLITKNWFLASVIGFFGMSFLLTPVFGLSDDMPEESFPAEPSG